MISKIINWIKNYISPREDIHKKWYLKIECPWRKKEDAHDCWVYLTEEEKNGLHFVIKCKNDDKDVCFRIFYNPVMEVEDIIRWNTPIRDALYQSLSYLYSFSTKNNKNISKKDFLNQVNTLIPSLLKSYIIIESFLNRDQWKELDE